MISVWSRAPFLRVLLPLATGIVLSSAVCTSCLKQWYLSLFSLAVIALVAILSATVGYHFRQWRGWLWIVAWLVIGFAIAAVRIPDIDSQHYSHFAGAKADTVVLETLHVPSLTAKGMKTSVRVRVVNDRTTTGDAMAFLSADFRDSVFAPGTLLLVVARFQQPDGALNPFAFDYKQYLARKYITHTVFIKTENVLAVAHSKDIPLLVRGEWWREGMLQILKRYTYDQHVFGILSALVLGKTDAMSEDILQSYSTAGTVHILAVSGLHVGLVYALLQPLFGRLFSKRKGRWIKTLTPLVLLWLFAGITGFSASVLRAAVMFSFFIVADGFGMKGNPINTLCASAVLLLAVNPMYLFDVGFQLSYAAVAGIVLLQKRASGLLVVHNKWLQQVWNLVAVSIVAQLATMPLTLVYFQQWPTYFLLSNLLAVPLSTVVLYLELGLLILHPIEPLAFLLGNAGCTLTLWMNEYVAWCSSLPSALLQVNWWSPALSVCSCGIMLYGFSWWLWCRPRHVRLLLVFFTLAMVCGIIRNVYIQTPVDAIVLQSKKSFCALVPANDALLVFADEGWLKSQKALDYACQPIKKYFSLERLDSLQLSKENNHILQWENHSLTMPYLSKVNTGVSQSLAVQPSFLRSFSKSSDTLDVGNNTVLSFCNAEDLTRTSRLRLPSDTSLILSVHAEGVCLIRGQWLPWRQVQSGNFLRFFGVGLRNDSGKSRVD